MNSEEEIHEEINISNEFASVRLRKIKTRNGERIEIHSNGTGLKIVLDPLQLESLVWQDKEIFSEFLAYPLEALKFKKKEQGD